MTRVIGLTGGMGSGKSTVSQTLAQLGAVVIDADKVGHEAYQPNTETWQTLVKVFGKEIIAVDNTIDRKKLGVLVFNNPDNLKMLNAIVHPRMYEMMKARIADLKKQNTKVIVVDAAILFEANWTPLVDEVWVVAADEDKVITRAVTRTNLPEEQIRQRLATQMTNQERRKRANQVIENNGTQLELRAKVKELWNKIKV
ncbi:MAG: dephospho-CoA kinase [Dehalococcoidales bacterium]|nr:dephospho-CoA kinase [Dehalococcoidales bacterium]